MNKPTGAMKREVAVLRDGLFPRSSGGGDTPDANVRANRTAVPGDVFGNPKITLAPVTAANAASAGYLIGRGETLGGVSEKSGTPAGLI